MIKILHLSFIFLSLISFIGRVTLLQLTPQYLQIKFIKIAPHIIDTLLLVSGITLVIQGDWYEKEFTWLIAKVVILLVYIGLGVVTMRKNGMVRWIAFIGALSCYAYIAMVAMTKNTWFLF